MWARVTQWTIRFGAVTNAGLTQIAAQVMAAIQNQQGLVDFYVFRVNLTTVLAVTVYESKEHASWGEQDLLPRLRALLKDFLVTEVEAMAGPVLAGYRRDTGPIFGAPPTEAERRPE